MQLNFLRLPSVKRKNIAILSLMFGGIIFSGCRTTPSATTTAQSGTPAETVASSATAMVSTTPSATRAPDDVIEIVGNAEFGQAETLKWKMAGVIQNVYVKTGEFVKAGKILAELRPDSLNPTVLQACKDLIEAQLLLEHVMESKTEKMKSYATVTTEEIAYQATKQAQEALYYPRGSKLEVDMAYDAYVIAKGSFDAVKDDMRLTVDLYEPTIDPEFPSIYDVYTSALSTYTSAYNKWNYLKGAPTDHELAFAQGTVLTAQRDFEKALDEFGSYNTLPRQKDVQDAKNKINAAEVLFDQRYIKAPFDGIVSMVVAEQDHFAENGATAFYLENKNRIYLTLNLAEIDLPSIHIGEKASVIFDALPEKTFEAVIEQISATGTVSDQGVIFQVLISMDGNETQIKAGMTALVRIQRGQR